MKSLTVYDFDGTIYRGDSTVDFLLSLVKKKKSLAVLIFPVCLDALCFLFNRDLTQLKSRIYSHFARRVDISAEGREFWQSEAALGKINAFIYDRPKEDFAIIASASSDFELKWISEQLGMDGLICTECDPVTGKIIGKNCKSAEKIRKIHERYGDVDVKAMYTDNVHADYPLLEMARERYLVTDGQVKQIDLSEISRKK